MDKKESQYEVSEDVTRESLIALSYTEPGEEPDTIHPTESIVAENEVQGMKSEADEKSRSGLISISNSQSPDTKVSPVSPGGVKG